MDTHFLAHNLTPIEQLRNLKKKFEVVKECLQHNSFSCQILVRPTALSEEYILKVQFTPDQRVPFSVFVLKPKPLKLAKRAVKLPHVYDNELQKLCLYRTKKREWNRTLYLSETAIPWAVEWLYFYEIWLCTGEWLGGGEHPTGKT